MATWEPAALRMRYVAREHAGRRQLLRKPRAPRHRPRYMLLGKDSIHNPRQLKLLISSKVLKVEPIKNKRKESRSVIKNVDNGRCVLRLLRLGYTAPEISTTTDVIVEVEPTVRWNLYRAEIKIKYV